MTAKIKASSDGLKVTIGNAAEDALEINQTAKTIASINGYSMVVPSPITSGALQSVPSGSLTVGSIPAGVRRVSVYLDKVKLSVINEAILLRLGPSSGIVSTGYAGSYSEVVHASSNLVGNNIVNGFAVLAGLAVDTLSGRFDLTLVDAATNLWFCEFTGSLSNTPAMEYYLGYKALAGPLTQLRIIANSGTVSSGKASVSWEV